MEAETTCDTEKLSKKNLERPFKSSRQRIEDGVISEEIRIDKNRYDRIRTTTRQAEQDRRRCSGTCKNYHQDGLGMSRWCGGAYAGNKEKNNGSDKII